MLTFHQYINEIKKDSLDYHLDDRLYDISGDYSSLPFDKIFGNKLRIVIPMKGESSSLMDADDIKSRLTQAGYSVDFDKGIAAKDVQTQRGPKTQQFKLGRLLQKLAKKDASWEDALHWWEMKADKTKKMGDRSGVSIVISRSPVDIIRMSDHSELSSCHSPGDSYFACAGQEARSGGGVAYVVRNSDLKTVDDLQAQEIFKDSDRDVSGVEPLERLRLRRLTVEGYDPKGFDIDPETDDLGNNNLPKTTEILIPEENTYGIRHTGFVDRVWEWAKKVQKPFISFSNPPNWKSVKLHGGSYQDTPVSTLWEKFFGTTVYGEKESVDRDEEESFSDTSELMKERAEQQLAERDFKHIQVHFEVEDAENEQYLFYSGSIDYKFNVNLFKKIPTSKDLGQSNRRSETKTLGDKIYNDLNLNMNYLSEIHIDQSDGYVFFYIELNRELGGGPDNDGFEQFLDECETIEQDYANDWYDFYELLKENGYIREEFGFEHFKEEGNLISDEMYIGDLTGMDASLLKLNNEEVYLTTHPNLREELKKFFNLPPSSNIQLHAKPRNIPESGPIQGMAYLLLTIVIPIEEENAYGYTLNIDKNWGNYNSRLSQWWLSVKDKIAGKQGGESQPALQSPPRGNDISYKNQSQQQQQQQQRLFPFKDWFMCYEKRNSF